MVNSFPSKGQEFNITPTQFQHSESNLGAAKPSARQQEPVRASLILFGFLNWKTMLCLTPITSTASPCQVNSRNTVQFDIYHPVFKYKDSIFLHLACPVAEQMNCFPRKANICLCLHNDTVTLQYLDVF